MIGNILFSSFVCLLITETISTNSIKDIQTHLRESRKQLRVPIIPPRAPGFKKKTGKDDGYYEPYWENGDWVFYRKGSTNKPQGFILNTNATQHPECNQICLQIYQDYGAVCGMRFKKDRHVHTYEYETFANMCYLEHANCVSKTKRLDWVPIKKGNCTEEFTTYATDATEIAKRELIWENRFPS